MRDDPELTHAAIHALNQWMHETWTFDYEDRIFATPVITLPIVERAIEELEWVVERGARVVLIRPAPGARATAARVRSACPSSTRSGRRWSRPTSSSPCTRPTAATTATPTSGWAATARCCRSSPRRSACWGSGGRSRTPSSALICHGALSRFPQLKVAVIENGSSWVEPLLRNLADVYKKMPQDFLEDPVDGLQAQHPHQPVLGGGPRRAGRAHRRRPGAVRVRLPAPRGPGRPRQLRRRAGRACPTRPSARSWAATWPA